MRRRLGVDFEYGYNNLSVTRNNKAISSFTWEAAAGSGDNVIVVTQVGSTLYFYLTDAGAVSDNQFDTIDLTTFSPVGSALSPTNFECQYAAGKGYLFVANPAIESFFVSYSSVGPSVTATAITLQIRDFEGVSDSLAVDERPAVLSVPHNYNLFNQGWDTDDIDAQGVGQVQVLTHWDSIRTDFPSNCDVWWYYRVSFEYSPQFPSFSPGNSPAPKGHYVLDYYDQDRDAVSGLVGLTGTTSGDSRAATIAFYAGRVWYSGVSGAGYSNRILFSQIIERDGQIGSCYQQNDPTSENVFDLLASDGGSILIPDSGTIIRLFEYADSLMIFTTNGVWQVSGSEGVGFRANDYSVVKISSIPVLTASSFVSVAGTPMFWNSEGIYTLSVNQVSASPGLQSLTDQSIKDVFDSIPYDSRKYARGVYNRNKSRVTWVYRSTAPTTVTERYTFDRVLTLNTISGAFSGWSFNIASVAIIGVVVCLASENTGIAAGPPTSAIKADVTKFVVAHGNNVTFADEWKEDYLDWYSFDTAGTDFDSSFTTGYKVHGDGQRKPQPTYINLFFDTRDVNSSLDFRSVWKYATSGSTGKWSTAQRLVTGSTDYAYTRKRIKSRGSGVAYQFEVSSVAGEPFNLIGWSVFETTTGGA